MVELKSIARDWLPPAVVRLLRQLRAVNECANGAVFFDDDFSQWADASAHGTGYDGEGILAKVLAATLKVKRGEAEFERDSVLFDKTEYAWPLVAGLMWAAARSGGRINVLDFGGALGSAYFQNRMFLQSLPDVCWNIVEQPNFVEAGRKYIEDKNLRFYRSIDECSIENKPNVILLSSVMQYLESPIDIVNSLNKVDAICMIIDRTPFSLHEEDKLIVQKVPAIIYPASYPMWIFSLEKFKSLLKDKWSLVSSNLSPEGYVMTTNDFHFSFQGMLWERVND